MTAPLRAIEVFDSLPKGCILHMERDDKHAPHVRSGEFVVVDPQDKEPIHGELFLIRWNSRRQDVMQTMRRHHDAICQPDGSTAPGILWMMCPLNRPGPEGIHEWIRTGKPIFASDGPAKIDGLRQMIAGRVVGLFQSSFDEAALKVVSGRGG